MKVLICYPEFWIDGGAEKVIIRLCNYMTEHSIDNSILTSVMSDEIKRQFTETRIIEAGNNIHAVLSQIYQDFDVVNFHNECQLLAYPHKMKSVWNFNELPEKIQLGGVLPEREISIVKDFIGNIIVADETNFNKVMTLYGKDSSIIPYGIDFEFLQVPESEDMRERFGIDKDDFVITQVGFIAPTKNQIESVKILSEVKKKIPNAKLVLAGLPMEDYKKAVEEEITKNNLYADVIFTGKLSHTEVRDLLKTSDVALQPNKGQGSWLSVFEAMACHLPVVVSEEFTASPLIKKEGLGYVCLTIEDYTKAIITEEETNFPNEKAYNFSKTLTWKNYCEKVVDILKKVGGKNE
jgi:glycosyltransferase involved in cell wall biosynthesis